MVSCLDDWSWPLVIHLILIHCMCQLHHVWSLRTRYIVDLDINTKYVTTGKCKLDELGFVLKGCVFSTAGRPDTATLCNELASVSDWRKLGLYLGVQDYELDQIERTYPTEGCDGWKRETFSLWLQHTPSASWGDVVGALRRMGENTITERIELMYIVGPARASMLYTLV